MRGLEIGMRVIPILSDIRPGIELDEPHAALHEAPRQQTLATEIVGRLLADPIQLLCRFRFIAEIDRVWRFALHAERELVGCDAPFQLRAVRVTVEVTL